MSGLLREYVAGLGWGGLVCSHWQEQTAESSDKGRHWVPNAIVPAVTKALLGFLYGQSVVFHPSLHSALSNITSFFEKEVRVAVGLWDSSFKNAFHTLSYPFCCCHIGDIIFARQR